MPTTTTAHLPTSSQHVARTRRRRGRVAVLATIAAVGAVGAFAGTAAAETDHIPAHYHLYGGTDRGWVSDNQISWGSGCSVAIGTARVMDTRADGMSVTVWRKYNSWPFDGSWRRIGYDDTSTSGSGFIYLTEYFCDSQGMWVATCSQNVKPDSNSSTARCRVVYREDNS